MAGNNSIDTIIFYENVSSLDGLQSKIFDVSANSDTMTLKFVCTDGTFQAKIYADIITKNPIYPYPAFILPQYTLIDDVISDGTKLYNVDLKAIDYIKIELVSLTGSITVSGKCVG